MKKSDNSKVILNVSFFAVVLLLSGLMVLPANVSADPVTGPKKVVVLRVYFQDYAATSRYNLTEVQGLLDEMDQLWQDTSYNNISISYEVSNLYQLPDGRSDYIDDFWDGDLSTGTKFSKVLLDAIDNAPATIDWTDVDAVNVLMAETDSSQFHRGQGGTCTLPVGPGGTNKHVGCAIYSENPTDNDLQVWGRWAHEVGHIFQQAGPAHPSNYKNEFELMDSNYPGQTGVFEKQSHVAFPEWMPGWKYQLITPVSGGGNAGIWAMEYDPDDKPNVQAVKIEITGGLYYLVSVKRRVLGDDLNGDFTPPGIPDEGVLIERVSEGSDPWVKVIGRNAASTCTTGTNCNRNKLWQTGDEFDGGPDGIYIDIEKDADAGDHYWISVAYEDQAFQPDVMLNPWTSPPGNTWETTDIWVDSPVNGYDTYRYGTWDDGSGNLVPTGNGDDPVVGQVNRVYARVRNVGASTATNVEVTWEITDPPGVGIAGASGWATIGTVTTADFPGLASIAPGDFEDVYIDWTPSFPVSDADMAAGTFAFHTCIRVKLNHVPGETVFGNQDGDREQENISYFQATDSGSGGSAYENYIVLHNDDPLHHKYFYINYTSDLPLDWKVDLAGGERGIQLGPDERYNIPIIIKPGTMSDPGTVYGVDVYASSMRLLVDDLNPKDKHPEYKKLGGVRVETRPVKPTKLRCSAEQDSGGIKVKGDFKFTPDLDLILEKYYNQDNPWKVMIQGVDKNGQFLNYTTEVVSVKNDASFEGLIRKIDNVEEVVCMFAGTLELGRAGSGYVLPGDKDTDGDGIMDNADNCPYDKNSMQEDYDHDGIGDVCDDCPRDPDNDIDNDKICGDVDNCPFNFNPGQEDKDKDGLGDVCDKCEGPDNDWDGDGICAEDNCPYKPNRDQADSDHDGIGDVCDICPNDPDNDLDNDGICGDKDYCPEDADNDSDKDRICGNEDNCPYIHNPKQEDSDQDGVGDICDPCPDDPVNDIDNDGICGSEDNCPFDYNPKQEDSDQDGYGDACDPRADLDNDGDVDADDLAEFAKYYGWSRPR